MIKTFGNRDTERIWLGESVLNMALPIQNVARRKLRMIHNSCTLQDLKVPPSNNLEKLKGDLKGFYSIRVNRQWRTVFLWLNSDAYEVKIMDYH